MIARDGFWPLSRWRREATPAERTPHLKDVLFIHTPKTGGTSLRNSLLRALPGSARLLDYGANSLDIADDDARAVMALGASPDRMVALRGSLPRDRPMLICGHLPAAQFMAAFHPASVITFLRHPVDRLVSNYRYQLQHAYFAGTFAEFLELPVQRNRQSGHLQGVDLRDLGFVGLTERMPEMIAALSRHLGVSLRMRRDNVSRRIPRPEVDAATRARILALNQDDLALYHHVEANLDYFTNYRARPGISGQLGRGKVCRTAEGTLSGWALARDLGQLAAVELRIGERVVQRAYADQFLPWLKKVTPHGVGGFQFGLPAGLAAADGPLRVVLAGTDKDLEGSPLAA
ncbi:MAG: hypothetical protein U1E23_08110 [Reyranellaceae bacterium]